MRKRVHWVLSGIVAAATLPTARPATEDAAADAQRSQEIIRCTQLSDLLACQAALSVRRNDPELLVAEADALTQLNRPGEAIGVYRNAFRSGARDSVVAPKIERAQALRRSLLDICQRDDGARAESACQAAWLPAAPDEVNVFKRRGVLLQNDGRLAAALEAYVTAARLAPRDRGVARAILALTGDIDRVDSPTLSARGGALLTLGRTAEAVATLRQALRLAPDSPEAQARLRTAQRTAPSHRSTAREAPDPPAVPADAANRLGNSFSNDAPVTRSN